MSFYLPLVEAGRSFCFRAPNIKWKDISVSIDTLRGYHFKEGKCLFPFTIREGDENRNFHLPEKFVLNLPTLGEWEILFPLTTLQENSSSIHHSSGRRKLRFPFSTLQQEGNFCLHSPHYEKRKNSVSIYHISTRGSVCFHLPYFQRRGIFVSIYQTSRKGTFFFSSALEGG